MVRNCRSEYIRYRSKNQGIKKILFLEIRKEDPSNLIIGIDQENTGVYSSDSIAFSISVFMAL